MPCRSVLAPLLPFKAFYRHTPSIAAAHFPSIASPTTARRFVSLIHANITHADCFHFAPPSAVTPHRAAHATAVS